MDFIRFYWELILDLLSNFTFKDWVTDIIIPLLNIIAVVYIFRLGEKSRNEEINMNNNFQSKLSDKNNQIQKELNDRNLKHNVQLNRPAFHIERSSFKISFNPFERVPLDSRWLEEGNVEVIKPKIWIKNIGNGNANNVIITLTHIDSTNYFTSKNIFAAPNGQEYKMEVIEEENTPVLKVRYESEIRTTNLKTKNAFSRRRYRLLPSKSSEFFYIEISDTVAFNYYMLNADRENNLIPYIRFNIEYYDDFENKYEDIIYTTVDSFVGMQDAESGFNVDFIFGEIHEDKLSIAPFCTYG